MSRALWALLLVGLLAAGGARAGAYPTEAEVASRLAQIAAESVGSTSVFLLGESRQGRRISGLRFGLPGPEPVELRPVLLVVAGLNADRRAGTAVALEILPGLRERAAGDEALAEVLRRVAVEVVPLLNPDGLAALCEGPSRPFSTNLRPVDGDRDGLVDEDGPEDLDGDGRISWMRVADALGTHRTSEEDPRLLVPADPAKGERGEWRLLTEGIDNDGDGRVNEDPPGGVELDRNFPHGWARHDPEAGPGSPSEPESRSLIEHALSRPIACVVVYGRHDNLSAPAKANDAGYRVIPNGPLPEDLPWIEKVRGLFPVDREIPDDAPDGAFHQWAYFGAGRPAFSTPLLYPASGPVPLTLPGGKVPTTKEGRWLAWSDAVLEGRGFTEWRPFEHPTLGRVEIGGLSPLLDRCPEGLDVAALVRAQSDFLVGLLREMPRPRLIDVRLTPVADGVFELLATLDDSGGLPLVSAMARRARTVLPPRVVLELSREHVLHGRPVEMVDRIPGRLRWLVRLAAGETLRIRAETTAGGHTEVEVRP